MNKLIYKIALLFIAVSLVSCQKGLMTFDIAHPDVYFNDAGKVSAPNVDSTLVSFLYYPKPDSVYKIVVAVTGVPADHDREYKVAINPMTTAVAGINYEALPTKFVIKKNAFRDTIKLKLFRTPDMLTKTFLVALDLLPNENFGTSWKSRLVAGQPISTITTKISFNDKVKQPRSWLVGAFGTFSPEKLYFICNFLGITGQYLDSATPTAGEINSYGKMVQLELLRLAAAGTPVYEANGVTLMTMGTGSM